VSTSQVTRHQSLRLCSEELRPGRSRPSRRWVDAVTLQDRPHARGGDDDAHGGELAVDAAVAPLWVFLRQPEDERRGSLRHAWPTGPAVRVGPALGDEVPVPTQQGFRSDEEPPESSTGEQSCEPRQNRPIRRLQRRSMDLAPEDCHLMAQHHDLDSEVRVPAEGEPDELDETAEHPVEERNESVTVGCSPRGTSGSKSRSRPVDGVLGTDRFHRTAERVLIETKKTLSIRRSAGTVVLLDLSVWPFPFNADGDPPAESVGSQQKGSSVQPRSRE